MKFWFEETGPKHWYKKFDAFDADIRRRFETIAIDVATDGSAWEVSPNSNLALIIILDQFSRNMYRETKAAFAWDCLLYTSPSPRDRTRYRMPSSA